MKKLLLLICALMFLSACNEKYWYVKVVRGRSVLGETFVTEKEEKTITASSDSAAYIEAFRNFCISQKVYSDMCKKSSMADFLDVPIGFKLYNSKGLDISDIVFATKKQQEEELVAMFMSMDNIVGHSKSSSSRPETAIPESKVDSAKIKELLLFFNVKKDEFDPDGITWYIPKSAPKYANRNGIYLYFAAREGMILSLRFKVQYYADDWIFFNKVQFSIDGKAYEYIPSRTERDHGSGEIWEWFDEALTGSDKDLIYALAGAKSAKMKFVGRQYYDIKKITNNQVIDMKRTLELYQAMGGVY